MTDTCTLYLLVKCLFLFLSFFCYHATIFWWNKAVYTVLWLLCH